MLIAKIIYKDKSNVTITIKKKSEEWRIDKHIRDYITCFNRIESVTVQKYPKKDNATIDWLVINGYK